MGVKAVQKQPWLLTSTNGRLAVRWW